MHNRPISEGRRRRQRGNQLVEVSLIFLPLFALLLALIDFSLALFLRATMQNAVREGVRYAVTYQTSGGQCQDASIRAIVKSSAAATTIRANATLNVVTYTIGLDGNGGIDSTLLKRMANDTTANNYDNTKVNGLYVHAPNSTQLNVSVRRSPWFPNCRESGSLEV